MCQLKRHSPYPLATYDTESETYDEGSTLNFVRYIVKVNPKPEDRERPSD